MNRVGHPKPLPAITDGIPRVCIHQYNSRQFRCQPPRRVALSSRELHTQLGQGVERVTSMSDSGSDTPVRPAANGSKHRPADESDDGSTSPRDKKRVKLEKHAADARAKKRAAQAESDQEDEEDDAPRPARKRGGKAVRDEDDEEMDDGDEDKDDDDDDEGDQVKQQLVRDTDGCDILHLPASIPDQLWLTLDPLPQLCNRIHRPDRVPLLPHVR